MRHAPFAQMRPEHVRQLRRGGQRGLLRARRGGARAGDGPGHRLAPAAPGPHQRAPRHRGAGWRPAVRGGRPVPGRRRAGRAAGDLDLHRQRRLLLPAAAGRRGASRWPQRARRSPTSSSAGPCTSSNWRARRCARATPRRRCSSSRSRRGWRRCRAAAAGVRARARRWPRRWRRCTTRRVGSVLVVDAQGAPLGILTRHDILGRVTLPALPLAHADRGGDERAAAPARQHRHAAGRGAADVAPRRAPRAGDRGRPAGQHRVRARPVRAAAAVAQAAVDAASAPRPTWRRCSARRQTSAASRATCSARACRRAS